LNSGPTLSWSRQAKDPHKDDPLGGMCLTAAGFGAIAGVVKDIADACCREGSPPSWKAATTSGRKATQL